jgi:hypothetical protein
LKELETLSDRLLLERCALNVETLCDKFDKIEKKNDDDHKLIYESLETKTPLPLFFWVLGIVILITMSLAGYTGVLKNEVTKNTTSIYYMENNETK